MSVFRVFIVVAACVLMVSAQPPTGIKIGAATAEEAPDISDPEIQYHSLPIGMNVSPFNYYSPGIPFTDVMTTAGEMMAFTGSAWDSEVIGEIARDENGYPLALPQSTSAGAQTRIRFLVNNFYNGRYRIYYDGIGTLGGEARQDSNGYYIDFNGSGDNKWIEILESQSGNHIRNMRIVPAIYRETDTYPMFYEPYIEGLEPFHAIRFMNWFLTNRSNDVHWADRTSATYYSQATMEGMAYEYAVEMSNQLQKDAWVNVPHAASDDYIRQMAIFWRDNLDPGLTIYLEYSNELWNWIFEQTHWVDENAPGAVDSYVSADLAALPSYPVKDAYMMARVFRIWSSVFGNDPRLVLVATGQQAWWDHSDIILDYLFNTDGIGCDVLSVGGYFAFRESHHNKWLSQCDDLTFEQMYIDMSRELMASEANWTRESARIAAEYGVDFVVYEGGQHMQPWEQGGSWCYNPTLWDFQIHPRMYDLYMHNFNVHLEPEVDCKLFMAYSYITERESQWGSWGHLENLSQVTSGNFYSAPKYQALLDINQ